MLLTVHDYGEGLHNTKLWKRSNERLYKKLRARDVGTVGAGVTTQPEKKIDERLMLFVLFGAKC